NKLHTPGNVLFHNRQLAVSIAKLSPFIAQVFEDGCNEGVFQLESPLETAELLLSGIQFLTDEGVYPWRGEDILRRVLAFPTLMEKQLGAAIGSFSFLLR